MTKSKGRALGGMMCMTGLPFAALAHYGVGGSYDTSTPNVLPGMQSRSAT